MNCLNCGKDAGFWIGRKIPTPRKYCCKRCALNYTVRKHYHNLDPTTAAIYRERSYLQRGWRAELKKSDKEIAFIRIQLDRALKRREAVISAYELARQGMKGTT